MNYYHIMEKQCTSWGVILNKQPSLLNVCSDSVTQRNSKGYSQREISQILQVGLACHAKRQKDIMKKKSTILIESSSVNNNYHEIAFLVRKVYGVEL
jgi:hypothetical protein